VFQVRIHGRRGQGVKAAADLIALAAAEQGLRAEAGSQRGEDAVDVTGWCRILGSETHAIEPVTEPDALLVLDPRLLHEAETLSGLQSSGSALVNSELAVADPGLRRLTARLGTGRCLTVPAEAIAMRQLGHRVVSTAVVGGFSAMTELLTIQSVVKAIAKLFRGKDADRNMLAADIGLEYVRAQIRALA
jgi:pyruvate ferredoxin oxidoreductase gamma subunit